MDNTPTSIHETSDATRDDVADLGAEIAELAKLKPLEYDRVREERAKEFGVRVGTLDNPASSARARRR